MVHCFCAAYVPSQQALLSSSMTTPPVVDSGADEWSGAGSFRHYDATERTGVSHRTEYVHMHMPRATCHMHMHGRLPPDRVRGFASPTPSARSPLYGLGHLQAAPALREGGLCPTSNSDATVRASPALGQVPALLR